MNIKIQVVFSLLTILLFTSCFEFIEEITFNKDGSGSAELTLNLSQSKTKLASIMLLDSVNGYKVPSKTEISKKVKEIVAEIKKLEGVHNVKSNLNFEEFIVSISCDFDNAEVLNTVISNFSSKKNVMAIKKHKHFKFDKTNAVFERSHHFNFGREVTKVNMKDRKILENANYTSIYRFESPIKTFKNKASKVAKSKKAILLKVAIQDVINNSQTIKNHIQLEN